MCHVNILPVFHGSEMGAKTEGVVCDDYYGFLDTFGKIWPCLRSQDIVGVPGRYVLVYYLPSYTLGRRFPTRRRGISAWLRKGF